MQIWYLVGCLHVAKVAHAMLWFFFSSPKSLVMHVQFSSFCKFLDGLLHWKQSKAMVGSCFKIVNSIVFWYPSDGKLAIMIFILACTVDHSQIGLFYCSLFLLILKTSCFDQLCSFFIVLLLKISKCISKYVFIKFF